MQKYWWYFIIINLSVLHRYSQVLPSNIFVFFCDPHAQQDVGVLENKLRGLHRKANSWRCQKTVKPGTSLWSRALIYNHPTICYGK